MANTEDTPQAPLMFTPRNNLMYAIGSHHEPIGVRSFFEKYGQPDEPKQVKTEDDDRDTVWSVLVYLGVERTPGNRSKDKQGQSIFATPEATVAYMDRHPLTYGQEGQGVHRFARKRNKCQILASSGIVGGVYLVGVCGHSHHELGRSFWLYGSHNAPIYIGRIADDLCARLQAFTKAERSAMTTTNTLDKIRSQDMVKAQLEPLRLAYGRMNTRQRALFVAEMIQYLEQKSMDPTNNW